MVSICWHDAFVLTFTRGWLELQGFTGFVRFAELPSADVPNVAGVYLAWRPSDDPPEVRESSAARYRTGKDPRVAVENLRSAWVTGARVVYIGKADLRMNGRHGLAQRLDEYRRQGTGEGNSHRGGRYIWHLCDADDLLVARKPTPDHTPRDIEHDLIVAFIGHYGCRPFANRIGGRRPTAPPCATAR